MATNSAVSLTMEQCAAAIVAMIQASPRSPRQNEIEAVVARVGGRATAQKAARPLAGFDLQLHDAIVEYLAANRAFMAVLDADAPSDKQEAADKRDHEALDRLDELAEQLADPPAGIPLWRVPHYGIQSRRDDEATNPLFEAALQYADR